MQSSSSLFMNSASAVFWFVFLFLNPRCFWLTVSRLGGGGGGQRCPLWTASGRSIGDDHSASPACIASRLHQCFKFNVAYQKREQDQSNHTCSSVGDTLCWPTCVTSGSILHLLHRSATSYEHAVSCILHVSGIMSSCWAACYSVYSQCQLTLFFSANKKKKKSHHWTSSFWFPLPRAWALVLPRTLVANDKLKLFTYWFLHSYL